MKTYRIEVIEEVRHILLIEADSLDEAKENWSDAEEIEAEHVSLDLISVTEEK